MIHKFLQATLIRVARFIHRSPGLIVTGSLALTVAAVWLTVTRLTVVDNTDSLISSNSPAQRYWLAYVKEFNVGGDYAVVIRSDDPAKNRAAAVWIGRQLEAMPELRHVLYRLDFSKLKDHFLLFLDEKDLLQIEQEVGGYARQLKTTDARLDLNSMLDQADAMFNDKYLRKSSNWDEFKPFVDHFAEMLNKLADDIESGSIPVRKKVAVGGASRAAQGQLEDADRQIEENEFPGSSDGGKTILVVASHGAKASDARPYRATIEKIRAVLAQARQSDPSLHIGLTGENVLTDDELASSSRDSGRAGLLAFGLVAVLFFVSYRRRTRPVVALGVLLMAVAWSLGFTVVAVGHLNIISQAFVAMVIGLGVDFGIQVMGRYEEELARGSGLEQALVASVGSTGTAVVTGGTTTAIAFYTMCFNEFVGLREFGIIAGSGVLLCLAANLVLLPACYVLMDRRKSPQALRQAAAAFALPGDRINRILFGRPVPVLLAAAALTAVAVYFIPRVSFDYNLLDLQDPHLEAVREARALNTPGHSLLVAVSVADNVAEARARIDKFKALPTVAEVHAPIVDMTPVDAEKKIAIIRRIVASLQGLKLNTDVSDKVDVARARADIGRLLADCREAAVQAKKYARLIPRAREAVEVFNKLIPPLERAQNAMQGLSQEELGRRFNRYQVAVFGTMKNNLAFLARQKTDTDFSVADVPQPLRDRFFSPNGKILIEVVPKEDVWDRAPDARFVRDLRTVDPQVTGAPVQNYEYIDLLRASYVQAAQYAAIAIVILIGLHFMSVGYLLLTILPLALAITWVLGLMGAIGYPFNPANVITLPLVIGIGVAYGVYTIDRFREDGDLRLFSGSTGKAIVLSALTAMIGFGSMMISSYKGLSSLGFLMFLGVGMCLLTSIYFLPQILALLLRRKKGK